MRKANLDLNMNAIYCILMFIAKIVNGVDKNDLFCKLPNW